MKLEEIGFYTLSDARVKQANANSPMWRCEMILTDRCNFKCPYCRGLRPDCRGDMPLDQANFVLDAWIKDHLKNVRFSGGEPTIYPYLIELVKKCKAGGVEHIAISTNGSADLDLYQQLVDAGANDFSVSLDACCASFADAMSGVTGQFAKITRSIKFLSERTYVTVGVVLIEQNVAQLKEIVEFAHGLGVADIRIISAAQYDRVLSGILGISDEILNAHPILKYRVENIKKGRNVRSLQSCDCHKCHLVQDDSVVCGNYHFPCVIYMREQGAPIGRISENMRQERIDWMNTHDTHQDPICQKNCLDVCIDYNNKCENLERKS